MNGFITRRRARHVNASTYTASAYNIFRTPILKRPSPEKQREEKKFEEKLFHGPTSLPSIYQKCTCSTYTRISWGRSYLFSRILPFTFVRTPSFESRNTLRCIGTQRGHRIMHSARSDVMSFRGANVSGIGYRQSVKSLRWYVHYYEIFFAVMIPRRIEKCK